MKPRIRWVSIPEVTDIVLARSNKVAHRLRSRPRRSQLQAVRRLVVRAEQRDDTRITKRVSGDIFVRFDALESLLPADAETVTRLEVDVAEVAGETRKIWKHVGAHGHKLREHARKIQNLEEEQELTTEYLERMQAVRSRAKVAL